MNIILSSCDFGNDSSKQTILDNLPKPIGKCRLLFIPNEKATYRKIHSEKYYQRMRAFGFCEKNTLVFDYDNPDEFKDLDIDVIYISGGNTFGTLDRIRKSGFDREIIRYVKNGVTYIGGSAGAHIASKDITHVLYFDSNDAGVTDFSGLSLFDGILICHFTPEREIHLEKLRADGKYNVYALTDEDSIVFN